MTAPGWRLAGVPVLVAGGGAGALAEVVQLRERGADVTVVAHELVPALEDLVDRGLVARGADVTEAEVVAASRLVVDARTPARLAEVLEPGFEVALHEPARAGRPWILDTTARTTP